MAFTLLAIKNMIGSISIPIFGIDPIGILVTIAISMAISKETNKRIMTLFPTSIILGIIGFNINPIQLILTGLLFIIEAWTTEGFTGFETTETEKTT